jgi:hypothetical protein
LELLQTGGAGPYRSGDQNSLLLDVPFNIKKLTHWQKRFINQLPENAAIVGGFARGMFIGSMKNVGDIDLAVQQGDHPDMMSKILTKFLESMGFDMIDRVANYGSGQPILGVNKDFRYCGVYFQFLFGAKKFSGIMRWNSGKIRKNKVWGPKQTVDILLSPPGYSIYDFMNLFDISICQFAYLNGHLYATRIAIDDLSKNQFRFLRQLNGDRAEKYRRKGYKNINDEEVDSFIEQFIQS